MKLTLKNLKIYENGAFRDGEISVRDNLPTCALSQNSVANYHHAVAFPGFVDVHVHLREPGFSRKETIRTGTMAAARGGFTTVFSMPNLDPTPDCLEHLLLQEEMIARDAVVEVVPYGAITRGERGERLADLAALAPRVAAFSDDGRGVQDEHVMLAAMTEAKRLKKCIAAHCEDTALLNGGFLHAGEYARMHGYPGISSESEWRQVERDLLLAQRTGCAYHVCHVSTRESVCLIRDAKARGVDVTCETAPHYLLLDDSMLEDDGRFRMNPPIRSAWDRAALLEGILDGTIDMIATDHAPHTEEEKAGGLSGSLNGVVGLETAFPILYTELVLPGLVPLSKLIELLHTNPRARFLADRVEEAPSFTVFDLEEPYKIDPNQFLSMGRSTPFSGRTVYGRCLLTVCGGKVVFREERA